MDELKHKGEMESDRKSSFAAGMISGLFAAVCLQPLDVVKTVMQGYASSSRLGMYEAVRHVYRDNGVKGFWRGLAPTAIRAAIGPGIYFAILHEFKESDFTMFTQGAVARGVAGTLLCPLSVVKTRLEWAGNKNRDVSLLGALVKIAREERFRGLFSGMVPMIIRDVPFSGIYLYLYKGVFQPGLDVMFLDEGSSYGGYYFSRTMINLTGSFVAGALATIITHPADVIKTHYQFVPLSSRIPFSELVKSLGLRGLFSGISTRVIRRPLSIALTWTVFELLLPPGALKSVQ